MQRNKNHRQAHESIHLPVEISPKISTSSLIGYLKDKSAMMILEQI